jgi:hypothetical protein
MSEREGDGEEPREEREKNFFSAVASCAPVGAATRDASSRTFRRGAMGVSTGFRSAREERCSRRASSRSSAPRRKFFQSSWLGRGGGGPGQEREVGVHHGAVVRGREIFELLLHHEAHGRRHGARIRVRGGWDARPQSLLDRDAGGGELLPAGVEQERRRVDQLLAALGSQHRDAHGRDARVGDALRAEVRHREVAQLGTGHRRLAWGAHSCVIVA